VTGVAAIHQATRIRVFLGIAVGIDIAIISIDEFQLAEILTPSLTVVQ
jgi:DNA-binding LacI/PurR family transcriptional regulator